MQRGLEVSGVADSVPVKIRADATAKLVNVFMIIQQLKQ